MSTELVSSSKFHKKKSGKEMGKADGGSVSAKTKSKSRSKTDVENLHDNSVGSTGAESRKETRKRKHHENDDPAAGIVVEDTIAKKKKKHKRRNGTDPSDADSDAPVERNSHKNKTRSKEVSANTEDDGTKDDAKDSEARATLKKEKKSSDKEPRKKSRNSHKKDNDIPSNPNPHHDATLSDKGRGALSYAYARFSSPDTWKFNKAHQNWIVKHFFSADAIPNIYVPVVVKYLEGCQGGVRQNLMQTCNKHLETPGPSQDLAIAASSTPTIESVNPTGGSTVSNSDTALPKPVNGGQSPNPQEEVKQRAEALRAALTGASVS